uniref:Uncharacterized protein n=1 Tax=Arundo donax TaxID=35708 RepID=A0A0A8Y7V3_ARUDO
MSKLVIRKIKLLPPSSLLQLLISSSFRLSRCGWKIQRRVEKAI